MDREDINIPIETYWGEIIIFVLKGNNKECIVHKETAQELANYFHYSERSK